MTSSRAAAHVRLEHEKQRYADRRAGAETDELPLREVQRDLSFDRGQVLGNGNVCQAYHLPQCALKMDFAMTLCFLSLE